MLIFLLTKNIKILSLVVKHYSMKADIIKYYLLPSSTALKLKEKCDYVTVQK